MLGRNHTDQKADSREKTTAPGPADLQHALMACRTGTIRVSFLRAAMGADDTPGPKERPCIVTTASSAASGADMETAQNFLWSGRTALNLQSELTDSITARRGIICTLYRQSNHITAIRADSVL